MKNKIQTIMAKHDPWHEDDFDSYENIAKDVSSMSNE